MFKGLGFGVQGWGLGLTLNPINPKPFRVWGFGLRDLNPHPLPVITVHVIPGSL